MARGFAYQERWALITGASAGIGEVFARKLAARGMNLVLAARREERLLELAAGFRRAHAISVVSIPADLSRAGEALRLWREASAGRVIQLLINNAGFGARGRFDEVDLERQIDMVQVNCTAVLELAHHALREMRARGEGGIVNVSSLSAFQPIGNLATYAASKAFVLSLSEALWAETRGSGVRVLALCPGRTPTEFQSVAGTGRAQGTFGARPPGMVVDHALKALEADRSYVVPGLENYFASWVLRVLPRGLVSRSLRPLVERAARRR